MFRLYAPCCVCGAARMAAMGLKVFIDRIEMLQQLKSIVEQSGRGRGKLSLVVNLDGEEEAEINLAESYNLNTNTRSAIKSLPGVLVQDI